jgi:hypothetical protein
MLCDMQQTWQPKSKCKTQLMLSLPVLHTPGWHFATTPTDWIDASHNMPVGEPCLAVIRAPADDHALAQPGARHAAQLSSPSL